MDSTKFLGINIDSKLTWKQHIDYIQHKISKTTGILCKARHYVSLKVLRTLYYALVYPYLHYGNVIWANTYQSRLETIRKLQKKIIRIITFSDYRDHTLPLFKKLSILPIDEINKEKCPTKLDCLIYEMLFIRNMKPKLNTQSDSIRAKLFTS